MKLAFAFLILAIASAQADRMCCQAITSQCRACAKGMTVDDYCFACVYRGMNDAGCYDCSRSVTHQIPSTVTPCQMQAQHAMSVPGRFTPQCTDDGSYSKMQCHGSTGYCWCVDNNGQEVANTRQAPGSMPNCDRAGLSPCQVQASQVSFGYGGFRPRCEVDGSYSATQCHSSTGYCWCVTSDGLEIDNTRVGPGTMPNCTKGVFQLSACQWAVQDAAAAPLGAFVPQCEADGRYAALQCHGSTGYCWCVTSDGTEIDGSKKGPGDMPACSVYTASLCNLQRMQAGRGIGAYVPQCEDDGSFSKMQCHASTGNCWCVDPATGIQINGTTKGPGNMPVCDANNNNQVMLRLTKCQGEVSVAAPVFGAFVPQCEADGSYSKLQCHGSTGYCWCVTSEGSEVPGSRKGPGNVVNCTAAPATLTPCQAQARQASRGYGSYRPQCEDDGSYAKLQCHGSTGYCWCVEQSTGKAIDSTRRGPGNIPDCYGRGDQQTTACQMQVAQSSRLLGSYTPQCEEDGSYSPLQCHASTGYCWCVDSNGQEILNTRNGPGRVGDCRAATLTPCQLQQTQASHGYGSFAPGCNGDGSYSSMQCHASTGNCWCVEVNGVEINGTRVGPGTVPDCSTQMLTHTTAINTITTTSSASTANEVASLSASASECEVTAASAAGRKGAFVPQCELDGSYSSLQCWPSTGYCWCVNNIGSEFPNSRIRGTPDCDLFTLTPCLLQRKQASPGFGSFRPRCNDDGTYAALQCHGSTGYCWCVSGDGKEIANTRVGPGGMPTCDSFKLSPKVQRTVFPKALMMTMP